jgi:uncharacterized protein YhbP (UPF0306 family)
MEINQTLLPFLQSQKVLVLATVDKKNNPWVSNVYFSVNKYYEFFFFSATDTQHSNHLISNENVSFAVVWHDSEDEGNRKAIQAKGVCKQIKDPIKLLKLVKNHYKYYPGWKEEGESIDDTVKKLLKTGAYVINPDYIKYWDDEEFGEKKTEEYNLV